EPKSLGQLGLEGHWLLDGLDAERRRVLVHAISPIPRFVLVRGFARKYRRRAIVCWGRGDATAEANAPRAIAWWGRVDATAETNLPRGIPLTGRVATVVQAPIEAVWRVVTDVTLV